MPTSKQRHEELVTSGILFSEGISLFFSNVKGLVQARQNSTINLNIPLI